jgi:hypothetical protein
MEKTIQINVPEGYEIDKEKSTFENIVFKPIKKGLPKSWEELEDINGYYVDTNCDVSGIDDVWATAKNRNVFATKKQAKAAIALAQLSQLREVYRAGWEPDYTCFDTANHFDTAKHVIKIYENNLEPDATFRYAYFLSFQTSEVRDLFLENFRDLIEQAKPLLS